MVCAPLIVAACLSSKLSRLQNFHPQEIYLPIVTSRFYLNLSAPDRAIEVAIAIAIMIAIEFYEGLSAEWEFGAYLSKNF